MRQESSYVIALRALGGEATAIQIRDYMGVHPHTLHVHNSMSQLIRSGSVVRVGKGTFRLMESRKGEGEGHG